MSEKQSANLRPEDRSTDIEQEGFAELLAQISADLETGRRVDWNRLQQEHVEYADDLNDIRPAMEALQNLQFNKHGLTNQGQAKKPDFLAKEESQTLGDFRLVREIGRGGMGVVYEAVQISIDRRVALKILPLAELIDERALARFKNEVTAIATLDHPHIVSVYAIGEQRGVHFYAMQLIHGQSLAVVIRELRARSCKNETITGKMIDHVVSQAPAELEDTVIAVGQLAKAPANPKWDKANGGAEETRARASTGTSKVTDRNYFRNIIRLIIQAAEALGHAHECGIVHRDIKPGNLLLNKKGKLYLTDFGLARIEAGAGVTMTGDVIGTLRYMSPEQVLAGRAIVDHRTDIYSLGATLYELMTLQSIWAGHDRADLISKISFEEPIQPQKINPAIPTDVETVILKSLSKNPNDRYANALELAEDLQRFLDDKPVVAKRPTVVQRINKWSRRNPVVVWSAVLLMAIVTIASVVSSVLISNEQERVTIAKEQAEQRLTQLAKGNEIMTSIFVDLDITAVKEGEDPLEAVLAKRLVKAGQLIEGESIGDSLVVAKMQERLAQSLVALGFPEEALHLTEKSFATCSALLEPNDPDLLESMNNRASALLYVDELEKAIELYEAVLVRQRAAKDEDDPDTYATINNLGEAYQRNGQIEKGEDFLKQSLAFRRTALGHDNPQTLNTLNNLAGLYLFSDRADAAIPLYEEALKSGKSNFEIDHVVTLRCMNNLAGAYQEAGRLDDAIPLFEQTFELRKSKLGVNNYATLMSMNNLGRAYVSDGKIDKAIPYLEQTHELTIARHGPDHEHTTSTGMALASAYLSVKRIDVALPLLEQLYEVSRADPEPDIQIILKNMNDLALAQDFVGRPGKAIPLYSNVIEHLEKNAPPDHLDTIVAIANLAVAYRGAGQLDRALELSEKSLRLFANCVGPSHPNRLAAMYNIAALHRESGRLEKALHTYQETLELRESTLVPRHFGILSVQAQLAVTLKCMGQRDECLRLLEEASKTAADVGEMYRSLFMIEFGAELIDAMVKTGHRDQAADLADDVLEAVRSRLPDDCPELARQIALLSKAHFLSAEAYSQAEVLLRESLAIYENEIPDSWRTFEVRSLLGAALLGQKEYDKAEPFLLSGHDGLMEREDSVPPIHADCIANSVERLVEFYESWNAADPSDEHAANAKKWQLRLDQIIAQSSKTRSTINAR